MGVPTAIITGLYGLTRAVPVDHGGGGIRLQYGGARLDQDRGKHGLDRIHA